MAMVTMTAETSVAGARKSDAARLTDSYIEALRRAELAGNNAAATRGGDKPRMWLGEDREQAEKVMRKWRGGRGGGS